MKIYQIERLAIPLGVIVFHFSSPLSVAATNLHGDYSVVASGGEPGNLSVGSDINVGGNISGLGGLKIGSTNYYSPSESPYLWVYADQSYGAAHFTVTEPDGHFIWADNTAWDYRPKMELDGDNNLSLFGEWGGDPTIVLSGIGGRVTLNGEGSGLYSGTTPLLTLNSGGNAVFGSGMTQHFANTTASNSSISGALTVAGGIGVGKDSYFNGVRVGRGGGNDPGNTAIGAETLGANSGVANTAVGYTSMQSNQAGSWNTAVGFQSLLSNTNGESNSAFGSKALIYNTTGTWNAAFGATALFSNTTGIANTAMGTEALATATTSNYSTAVGRAALYHHATGDGNTAVGAAALQNGVAVDGNTGVGSFVMLHNVSGNENVMLGSHAGYRLTSGSQNIMIGFAAGNTRLDGVSPLTGAEKSIYIGTRARGVSNGDENAIVIGHEAISEGANTTVIGNTATTRTKINGSVETPKVTATSTTGNALVVEGGTLLNGQVILGQAQGDISMGIYQ